LGLEVEDYSLERIRMEKKGNETNVEAQRGKPVDEARGLTNRLLQLRGVLNASVVRDDSGRIGRVNVVAEADSRSRSQLSRDVVSLVAVEDGGELRPDDVDAIFISNSGMASGESSRPLLVGFSTHYSQRELACTVTLQLEGREVEGSATLPGSQADVRSLVNAGARAALQAAQSLLDERCQFSLEDARLISLLGQQVALVAVSVHPEMGTGLLLGSVLIRRGAVDAAARAALDAINRTFTY